MQGWHSGENNRFPPVCREFNSQTCRHMWVAFVGSLPVISMGTTAFPSPQKPAFDFICVNLLISVYRVPN